MQEHMSKGFPFPHWRWRKRLAWGGCVLEIRFLALVLCGFALLGAACGQDTQETAKADAPPVSVAPSDVFSRRAPAPSGPTARKWLLVGDSLSISLGEQMERALAGVPGLDFARDGMRSTGLTRPELLDWPSHLRDRAAAEKPDVVVIMLGANDVMPVVGEDGNRVYFENPAWAGAYAAKARELVAICKSANPHVSVYWVGVPSMGEASLAAGVPQVNAALAGMCGGEAHCRFIDTYAAFSDPEGRFTRHARDAATGESTSLRTADGVHMTDAGAKLLAGITLKALAKGESLPSSAGVDELRALARDLRPVAEEAPKKPERTPPAKAVKVKKQVYSVKNGDTMLSIARRLGVEAEDLVAANPSVDTRRLSIGQDLRIPADSKR